jgi:hypothetical protein
MTSLLSAKKRAEEFAAVVDGAAEPSTLRPELVGLVGVVATLQRESRTVESAEPRPEFTASLRERLMAEAATSLAQDTILTLPPRRKGSRERRIALAASSLVLVGGTAGMAAAAQNALPGEALYPIKRGLEKAQTELATNDAERGKDLLAQADSRLVEVRGLFDSSGNLSQVPGTIDAFTQQATEATEVLLDEFDETRDPQLIEGLRAFAADNLDELQQLAKTAPAEHQDDLATAADVLMRIDARAEALCPACASDLETLTMPPLFLAANEARDALDAVRRAEVDNSHPVVTGEVVAKPADKQRQTPTDAAPEPEDGTDDGDGNDGTGGSEDPALPEIPTGGTDTDGPSGDGDLGKVLGEATGGLGTKDGGEPAKGGKQLKKALPEELDPIVDTLLP